MPIKVTDLRHAGAERLAKAVRKVIERKGQGPGERPTLPGTEELRAAAAAAHAAKDDERARRFQSILELGYLVASADGLADEERHTLATLLEQATGSAVNRDELELHFKDLDDAVEMLGRRERLRRAAADFEDTLGRSEALGFTALIAVADGVLGTPEADALTELGAFLELPESEVVAIVDGVTSEVERALGG
jgi:tellurite resistance protein